MQDGWLSYVPVIGVALGLVGLLVLGVQNAVLAAQVTALSAEVTALHEFVAQQERDEPRAAGPQRMGRPPGAKARRIRPPAAPGGAPPGPRPGAPARPGGQEGRGGGGAPRGPRAPAPAR